MNIMNVNKRGVVAGAVIALVIFAVIEWSGDDRPETSWSSTGADAGLLGRIVFPEGATFDQMIQNLDSWMEVSEGLYRQRGRELDPRLRQLASDRRGVLRAWSRYGRNLFEARDNPAVPVSMLERELRFHQEARDVAVDLAPGWVSAADETIASLRQQIRIRG
jgi:hypothetical protein